MEVDGRCYALFIFESDEFYSRISVEDTVVCRGNFVPVSVGRRANTAIHYQVAADHGFTAIASVVIMDEKGDMEIPVTGGKHLQSDCVSAHFADYDIHVV